MSPESLDVPTIFFKERSFAFIKDRRNGTKIYGVDNGIFFFVLDL